MIKTWDDLKRICFGHLGLSQDEFWSSSLHDLALRMLGFYELENERLKEQYEQGRLWTWYLLNIHIDQKHRLKSPESFCPFPWDADKSLEKKKKIVLSEEEKKKRFDKMDKAMLKKYGPK